MKYLLIAIALLTIAGCAPAPRMQIQPRAVETPGEVLDMPPSAPGEMVNDHPRDSRVYGK